MTTSSHETPRAPLQERKRQRAREQIVTAAHELFAHRGYAEVTVSDIVDRAEVGRSTFFRYFGDKQEVVFHRQQSVRDLVVEREFQRSCRTPETVAMALSQLRTVVVETYEEIATDATLHRLHEKLIDENPELYDRHVRKLLGFADDMAALIESRGAKHETAVLAAQVAIACCLAARQSPTASSDMPAAVGECFDRLQ